jgi:hypothetical protein
VVLIYGWPCCQDCVVGTVTRLRAGCSGVRIPTEARDFSVLQKTSRLAVGPTQCRIEWVTMVSSLGWSS